MTKLPVKRRAAPPAPTPEQFLARFPPPIQQWAGDLRRLVREAVPGATEQVKLGWRLIGLYVPGKGRGCYFGFIIPHPESVTLGFEYGVLLEDPHAQLLGAAERLLRVRYLSVRDPAHIRRARFKALIRQAAEAALMPAHLRAQLLRAPR